MKYVALDIETSGLDFRKDYLWMVAIHYGKSKNDIEVLHDCNGKHQFLKKIKTLLEDKAVCKIIHNASFDGTFIKTKSGIQIRNIWDSRLAEVVIQGIQIPRSSKDESLKEKHSSSLKYTLPRYGLKIHDKTVVENFIGRKPGVPFTKKEIDYVKGDVANLHSLRLKQLVKLEKLNLLEVAELENKVVERVIDMQWRGIGFDKSIWLQLAEENETLFNAKMKKLPKEVNNWNSEKQVKQYFMSKGIMIDSYSELDKIAANAKNKTLDNFIDTRSLHKSVTTYGKQWVVDYVNEDNRVRTKYEQILNTGRFSSNDPNLQQIPSDSKHRAAFVPKPGHVFIIADFSGQEIGIMAAASEESMWIDALLNKQDVHSLTASVVYGSEWDNAKEKGCTFPAKCKCVGHIKQRTHTKTLNFMLAYGGGPQKFAESTGLQMWEAKAIVTKYKKAIPTLNKWLNSNASSAISLGVSYSADPFKRMRVLNAEEEWQIANQGKNNPVQSAGANMLKKAMINIQNGIPIVLIIHDEIICEVEESIAKKALLEVKSAMQKAADYITQIKGLVTVEPRIGINLIKEPCADKNHAINKKGFCTKCGHLIKDAKFK
jgi:DNA polymerase I-like protein with 3'-5' exonuclease and polymerase domains